MQRFMFLRYIRLLYFLAVFLDDQGKSTQTETCALRKYQRRELQRLPATRAILWNLWAREDGLRDCTEQSQWAWLLKIGLKMPWFGAANTKTCGLLFSRVLLCLWIKVMSTSCTSTHNRKNGIKASLSCHFQIQTKNIHFHACILNVSYRFVLLLWLIHYSLLYLFF